MIQLITECQVRSDHIIQLVPDDCRLILSHIIQIAMPTIDICILTFATLDYVGDEDFVKNCRSIQWISRHKTGPVLAHNVNQDITLIRYRLTYFPLLTRDRLKLNHPHLEPLISN